MIRGSGHDCGGGREMLRITVENSISPHFGESASFILSISPMKAPISEHLLWAQ